MALTPAEKQKRYRDRQRLGRPASSPEPVAVGKLVDAGTAARATRSSTDELWAAFEAGLAARVFCEITQGMTGGDQLLIDWLENKPSGLWLFNQFLTEHGMWGQFEAWPSSSRPAAV